MPDGRVGLWVVAMAATVFIVPTIEACPTDSAGPVLDRAVLVRGEDDAIDAALFVERLQERYRALEAYEDRAHVVHVTQREGASPRIVETMLICSVRDGTMEVRSPGSQAGEALGLRRLEQSSAALRSLRLQYQLWLAPHLSLVSGRSSEDVAVTWSDFGYRPVDAQRIKRDGRSFVQVMFRGGEKESPRSATTMTMEVDARTMLVERLEIEERLPDGGRSSRVLQIMPLLAQTAGEASAPPISASAPRGSKDERGADSTGEPATRTTSKTAPVQDAPATEPPGVPAAPAGRAVTTPPRD